MDFIVKNIGLAEFNYTVTLINAEYFTLYSQINFLSFKLQNQMAFVAKIYSIGGI